ncbi:MAG: sensor domain-containing diguanylate cyclase [Carbonactinosporaceae bacterium]
MDVASVPGAAVRLRALSALAKAVAGAPGSDEVVVRGAAEARRALGAASLSMARWERELGRLRMLVNDGDLAPGEEPYPAHETYAVTGAPELLATDERTPGRVLRAGDPDMAPDMTIVAPVQAALLLRRRADSCLSVPIVLEGHAWGELYATRAPGQPPFDAGDVDFAGVVAAQISAGLAQARHFERIERLAYQDPLTGLANRRAIDERLDGAIDRHRGDGTIVSLVVCDVNGLKRVNDDQGHDAGDQLLVHLASLLSASSALLPGSLAARLGGDEFCIMIEGHTADEAVWVAEDLCRRAADMPEGAGVACGVASTADPVGPVTSADRLFRLADAAQYRAKRGRSRTPVVAGRGQPPDATVTLVEQADHLAAPGDRRRIRGRLAQAEPAQLLRAGLVALDEVRGRDTLTRLEAAADTVTRLVDGAGWWVSYVPRGSRVLRTVRYSVYRMPGEPSPARELRDALRGAFDLAEHPQRAAAAEGDAFVLEMGVPGNDPFEEAALAAGGYRAVLAAGVPGPGGGWLVEVLTDEISGQLRGLEPALRALLSVAVTGASS